MAFEGEDILPIARDKLNQRYVLGARAPLTNPNWDGPWDCAEFASWCAYRAYGVVFGVKPQDPRHADAFSGFWWDQSQAEDLRIPISQALATPGAFLLRKPRPGLIGHVAICVGGGMLVEAAGAALGVVERANTPERRWDGATVLPGVRYSSGPPIQVAASATTIYRVQNPYMRGDEVRRIQQALAARGYHPGAVDGIYGELTEAAVAAFQRVEGLVVDGEVGPATLAALAPATAPAN